MATHLLGCSCGRQHRVAPAQAGQWLDCECGHPLAVPSIRRVRELPLAQEEDSLDDTPPGSLPDAAASVPGPAPHPTRHEPSVDLVRQHLCWGWWLLALFVAVGVVLDAMHGLKVDAFLNVSRSGERACLSLAHGLGTSLALLHLLYAATRHWLGTGGREKGGRGQLGSACLKSASLLIPAAFALAAAAGSWTIAVSLAMPGAALLIMALAPLAFETFQHATEHRPGVAISGRRSP